MRATLMYRSGDVRVEEVPDPTITAPTDAIIRVTHACVCGSDLHPYHDLPDTPGGRRMGHEAIGVVTEIGSDVSTLAVGDTVIVPVNHAAGPVAVAVVLCWIFMVGLLADVGTVVQGRISTLSASRASISR